MTSMFLNNVLGKMYFFFFNNIFLDKFLQYICGLPSNVHHLLPMTFVSIYFQHLVCLIVKIQSAGIVVSYFFRNEINIAKRVVSSTILAFRIIFSCTLVVMHITRWSFCPTFFLCLFHKTDKSGGNTPFLML